MFQELKFQLSTAILTIVTLAAGVAAFINFQQQHKFRLPDDGVIWVDRHGGVEALSVPARSEGARAGLRTGDRLIQINGVAITKAIDVAEVLARLGSWKKATYTVSRGGVVFPIRDVIIGEVPLDRAVVYQYLVGLSYLIIVLFLYFRRGSAHKARHFYILCLVSFIFFSFHYTGQLHSFDTVIYFGNVAAGLLAPAIFLHFCLTFPEPRKWLNHPARVTVLYIPALLLFLLYVAFSSGILTLGVPLLDLRWALDRVWVLLSTVPYLIGAIALSLEYRRAEDPIVRQQLKWLRNGTFCGILPFGVLYIIPYALGSITNEYLKMSVLSLPLIPLTLAYAIVRYRLMDVDIIFRRGYAYTLATLCLLAAFYAIVFSLGSAVQKNFKDLGNTGLITVMLITAFLFQPIRNWIQERLDKYFYRDQYDYRRTLIEFARELSSETDLDAMLASVGDRLLHTLSIKHLAFFLAEDGSNGQTFRLKKVMGLNSRLANVRPDELDLSFLGWKLPEAYLFFERTRHQLDAISQSWPASVRRTIAELDLTYYLPCTVRGRTIAYLGVGRTETGDFLSSDDVELLVTLSGYVGIAVDNAMLYRSLARKAEEYERLKEFSENIVESIHVGILAADLDDRVESWNSQIEHLTGIARQDALGRPLRDLLPADLCGQIEALRMESGVHNLYKYVYRTPKRESEATLNIAIAPLVSREGDRIGRLIIFDDITDRAELERRLVQADKLSSIGLLAAGVAHEVNTPLAVISTYAQMLAKQISGDEQKAPLLEKIARQTFRASEIVNSLLNFSRTSPTEFVSVDLNKVIRETLTLLEHQLAKAAVKVELSLDESLPRIKGNAGKLQQVFLNLFINARDAMESGGTLAIRSEAQSGLVHVTVADSGAGIAPENLSRIFEDRKST